MLSFDCFKECLDEVPLEVAVDFSGMSEPWRNPAATEMVQYAVSRGHRVRIHSTLSGMTEEDVMKLSALPLESFRVHLPSDENLEKINVDGQYLKVLDAVASCIPVARFVCFGRRVAPETVKVLKKYPHAGIRLVSASNRGEHECSAGKPLLFMGRGAIRCSNNARYNILLPNGEVALCCMDYGLKHILGDLRTVGYHGLFHGREFSHVCAGLKDPSLKTICRYCTVFACHADILTDIYDHLPHWFSCFHGIRNVRQIIRSVIRNIRRYDNYFRKR